MIILSILAVFLNLVFWALALVFPFVVGSGGVLGISDSATISSTITAYVVDAVEYANAFADVFPPAAELLSIIRWGLLLELVILGIRLTRMFFNFVRGSGA